MNIEQVIEAMLTKKSVWSDWYGKPYSSKIVFITYDYKTQCRVQLFDLVLEHEGSTSFITLSSKEIFLTEKECWDSIPDDQKHKEEYAEFLTKEAAK
jgi:hypothetical protein